MMRLTISPQEVRSLSRIPLSIFQILMLAVSAGTAVTAELPSDPELVYLRVNFVERDRSRPMRGITPNNLKVFEDGKPQDIRYLSEDTLPLQLEIIWDINGDTKDDLKGKTLGMMKGPGDRTDDILVMEPGKVSLSDAVLQALNTLAQSESGKKRALVLFTSRSSPGSYPLLKVRDRLKALDIRLYVVSQQTSSDLPSDTDRQALQELAEMSGGSAYFPKSSYELTDISRKVNALIQNQYLLGYRSTNPAMDGKWRKLKITGEYLDDRTKKLIKFDVVTRPGYYAPSSNGTRPIEVH